MKSGIDLNILIRSYRWVTVVVAALHKQRLPGKRSYRKRQIYLPFTIAASGGCERARKEISRFAARARRGVNVQNEIRFDVYDNCRWDGSFCHVFRFILSWKGDSENRLRCHDQTVFIITELRAD